MSTITSAVKTFIRDEDGITAIEYGLMAALIATALVTAVGLLTEGFTKIFGDIKAELKITPPPP